MKTSKADLFTKRINKLSRYSNYKLLPKRQSLIEEFKAVPCSFDNTQFRVDGTMVIWSKSLSRYEVK